MSGVFTRIWLFIKKWLARLGLTIILGGFLLGILGVPVDQKFLIGVITVILLGIYEIVYDTKNTEIANLKTQVAEAQRALKEFLERATPKLYSLYLCKTDLEEMLKKAPPNETIVIDHIGLDMSQAWEYIHRLLFDQHSKPFNVEYNLLILSDDNAKGGIWPREVVHWSETVSRSLERIHSDMETSLQLFKQERRKLKFTVKKYEEVPVVHGWSLRHPIKVWHVGHCRWRKSLFDWGAENFVKIDEFSQDPVTVDIANLFDSYFEHLWLVASPVQNLQLDFDPNKPVQSENPSRP